MTEIKIKWLAHPVQDNGQSATSPATLNDALVLLSTLGGYLARARIPRCRSEVVQQPRRVAHSALLADLFEIGTKRSFEACHATSGGKVLRFAGIHMVVV
jgi:hypothetical protein